MNPVAAASDPRTLVVGYNGSIEMFTRSPLRPRARASAMRWMFSSLLRFDEQLNLRGDLADRYERSADGRSYTFHLRQDVRWHDGHPFTADDVIFTAELLMQPHRYFRNTLHLAGGEPVEFRKVDDFTVRVDLPRPYVALPAYLTATWASLFLVVPRHSLRDGDEAAFDRHPIGTGPFRFGEITDDGNAVLTANPDYFRGPPAADQLVIRCIAPGEDRLEAFARGELDLAVAPGRRFGEEDARRHHGRFFSIPSNQIVQFAMNCRHPLFQSAGVRRAIACAVNKERLVHDIEGPDGLAAHSPVGPSSWAYEPNVPRHPYDPDRARRLLAEEGWQPGPDGLLRRGDDAFRFGVIYMPDPWNVDYAAYAAGVQKYLRAVGIELKVRPVDYWSGMKPAWRNHDFEAFLYYDTFYNEPDLYWSWHSAMPKRPNGPEADVPAGLPQYGYGVSGYANARVDRLIEAAREELDPERRKEQLAEAQRLMAEEVASLWLFNYPYRNVVHDRLDGISAPSLAEGTSDLIVTLHPERLRRRTAPIAAPNATPGT
jgi:peptide/nickel transport system substrate-binding protein